MIAERSWQDLSLSPLSLDCYQLRMEPRFLRDEAAPPGPEVAAPVLASPPSRDEELLQAQLNRAIEQAHGRHPCMTCGWSAAQLAFALIEHASVTVDSRVVFGGTEYLQRALVARLSLSMCHACAERAMRKRNVARVTRYAGIGGVAAMVLGIAAFAVAYVAGATTVTTLGMIGMFGGFALFLSMACLTLALDRALLKQLNVRLLVRPSLLLFTLDPDEFQRRLSRYERAGLAAEALPGAALIKP